MTDILFIVGILAIWYVLMAVVFPKLGIRT